MVRAYQRCPLMSHRPLLSKRRQGEKVPLCGKPRVHRNRVSAASMREKKVSVTQGESLAPLRTVFKAGKKIGVTLSKKSGGSKKSFLKKGTGPSK